MHSRLGLQPILSADRWKGDRLLGRVNNGLHRLQFLKGYMAEDSMPMLRAAPGGHFFLADLAVIGEHLLSPRAAGMEPTTAWRVECARYGTTEADLILFHIWIGDGHRREQCLCVGMIRRGVDRLSRAYFHDLPEVHHRDIIGEKPNHA